MSDLDDDDGGDFQYEDEDDGFAYDEAGSEISNEEAGFDGFRDDDHSESCSDNQLDDKDDDQYDLNEPRDLMIERGGLLDLEASEDDSHTQRGSDDESESSSNVSGNDLDLEARCTSSTFHAFPRLPPELREMVWLAASSDLTAQSRVFELTLVPISKDGVAELWPSALLEAQTASARVVLATCRESRAIALKRFPDTLPLYGKRFDIRCNLENDIIYLGGPPGQQLSCRMPEFGYKIRHVALDVVFVSRSSQPGDFPHIRQDAQDFVLAFPRLKTLYTSYSNEDIQEGRSPWFKTCALRTYSVHGTERTEYGSEEDVHQLYCWPVGDGYDVVKSMFPEKEGNDPEKETGQHDHLEDGHWIGDESEADLEQEKEKRKKDAIQAIVDYHDEHGFWLHPMITFQFEEGMHLFKTMMRWRENPDDTRPNPLRCSEMGEDGYVGESELDEYESEGIDDDDISESLDDDDLDAQLDDTIDGDGLDSDDYDLDIPATSGHGPLEEELFNSENDETEEDDSGEDPDTSLDAEDGLNETELPAAHFSSPEAPSRASSGSEEEESPVQRTNRKRHLARVVESDTDSDSEDAEMVQMTRRAKRRIVSSDSEEKFDDGGTSTSRPAKRARVIVSDDDEDED